MKVVLNLTQREVAAVLRCEGLSNGYGIIRSQALRSAEMKLRAALTQAQEATKDDGVNEH